MPDDVTDNTVDSNAPKDGEPAAAEAPKVEAPKAKTYTQAEVDALVAPLQSAAAELKTIKDGEKTELQKALDRAEEAEKRAEKAEFTSLRNRVAATKGVPASSLTGKTEDELNASADELIAWRDQHAPKPEPKQKRNPAGTGGGLKSGATGSGGDALDPKEKAAAALRELRGNS